MQIRIWGFFQKVLETLEVHGFNSEVSRTLRKKPWPRSLFAQPNYHAGESLFEAGSHGLRSIHAIHRQSFYINLAVSYLSPLSDEKYNMPRVGI